MARRYYARPCKRCKVCDKVIRQHNKSGLCRICQIRSKIYAQEDRGNKTIGFTDE